MEVTVAVEGDVGGGVDGKGHRMGVVGARDYGSDSLGLSSADQVLVDTQYLVAVVAAVAAVVAVVAAVFVVMVFLLLVVVAADAETVPVADVAMMVMVPNVPPQGCGSQCDGHRSRRALDDTEVQRACGYGKPCTRRSLGASPREG